jgi:hypothetical protein
VAVPEFVLGCDGEGHTCVAQELEPVLGQSLAVHDVGGGPEEPGPADGIPRGAGSPPLWCIDATMPRSAAARKSATATSGVDSCGPRMAIPTFTSDAPGGDTDEPVDFLERVADVGDAVR